MLQNNTTQKIEKSFIRKLYVGFLLVIGLLAITIIQAVVKTVETQKRSANIIDYKDIQKFNPRREGGHLLPNIDGWMKGESLDRPVRIITNSKGFRNDREFDHYVPPGTMRILFLGDSYVDGMRTDQRDTIGYQLEQRLNLKATGSNKDRYEVMISGHNNPTNAWYYYQEFGHHYHPQIVILGVTLGNDLTWHSYRSTFQPMVNSKGEAMLAWNGKLVQSQSASSYLPKEAYIDPSAYLFFKRIESRLRSTLHDLFPQWGGYLIPAATYPAINDRRQVDMEDFSTSLGLFYQPVLPHIEQQYVNFAEVITGFKSMVENHGASFIIVLFPTRLQASAKEWQLFLKFYFLESSKFDLSYPNQRILELCKNESLHCIDLLPAFKAHYDLGGLPLYRPHGDMHMNETGQRISADEIFSFLRHSLLNGHHQALREDVSSN
ncbi:MAG TPA: hypothetical protein VFS39_05145 [Nitrospira sp.]|nr:hypothetical protein [Nitrospira sp.]